MKHLSILLLCLITYTAQAQQYTPMPVGGARWLHRATNSAGGFIYQWMVNGADTVIDGISYKQITKRGYDTTQTAALQYGAQLNKVSTYPDEYVGAIREADKKVYIRMKNHTSERLYLDFNSGFGDTVCRYPYTYVVQSMTTTNLSGDARTVYHAKNVYNLDITQIDVIEGIGTNYGLNVPLTASQGELSCLCYRDDKVTWPSTVACPYIWPYGTPVSVAESNPKLHALVYPNPFIEVINLDVQHDGSVSITDIVGSVVLRQSVKTGITQLRLNNIGPGIYMLLAADNAGATLLQKRILKL